MSQFYSALIWDFKHPLVRNQLQTALSTADSKRKHTQFSRNSVILTAVEDDILHVKATGADPYFVYNLMSAEVFAGADNPTIVVRYKTSFSGTAKLTFYFATPVSPFVYPAQYNEATLVSDGFWHDLQIDMSAKPAWMSKNITALRFGITAGSEVDIDYIAIGQYKPDKQFGQSRASDSLFSQTAPCFFGDSVKFNKLDYGTYDSGAVVSIANVAPGKERGAGILGVSTPAGLASYSDRDLAALYMEITGLPPTLTIPGVGAVYTATSITFPPLDLSRVQIGMVIDTLHSPKWTGVVTDVNYDTSSIFVDAWYLDKSSPAQTGVPLDRTGALVNPNNKIWGQNTNVFLDNNSQAPYAVGYELGIVDNRSVKTGYTWGFDCVNLGAQKGTYAFTQRGAFNVGYASDDKADVNFLALSKGTTAPGELKFFGQDTNIGTRVIGQVAFGTTGYDYSLSIKGIVEGATDGSTALSFTTSKAGVTKEAVRLDSAGNLGVGTNVPKSKLHVVGLQSFADNASALAGGLNAGAFYHTSGVVKVVI